MPLASEAAGMQWTTIEDLTTYAAAFANHGLVGGRSVVTGSADATDVDYGVDCQPATWAPDHGFGHAGGWITYTAGLQVLPHHGLAVVMLANANPAQAFPAQSTFDIAFDTMRVANGWPTQRDGPVVGWFYAWTAVVIALLVLGLALRWLRLPARRSRWARAGRRGRMTLTAAREAWFRLWTSVPDLAVVLLALAVGALSLGVAGVVALRGADRRAGAAGVD